MRTVAIAEAKNRLPELIHEAESEGPLGITRRGRPVAVLVPEAEYQRMAAAAALVDFAAWAATWRARLPAGFEGITAEEVDRWRQP